MLDSMGMIKDMLVSPALAYRLWGLVQVAGCWGRSDGSRKSACGVN